MLSTIKKQVSKYLTMGLMAFLLVGLNSKRTLADIGMGYWWATLNGIAAFTVTDDYAMGSMEEVHWKEWVHGSTIDEVYLPETSLVRTFVGPDDGQASNLKYKGNATITVTPLQGSDYDVAAIVYIIIAPQGFADLRVHFSDPSGSEQVVTLGTNRGFPTFTELSNVPQFVLCPGDANGDLFVNSADLNIVAMSWMTSIFDARADMDNDLDVDSADLNIVGTNWQNNCNVAAAAPVGTPAP